MKSKKFKIAAMVFFGILAFAGFIAVTMLLWNWLVPALFSLPAITYWQAAGLLILGRILFGGMSHCRHHSMHGGWHNNKLRNKWRNMSEEERREFVQNRRKYWSEMNHEGHMHYMHKRHGMCCDGEDSLFEKKAEEEKKDDQNQKHE